MYRLMVENDEEELTQEQILAEVDRLAAIEPHNLPIPHHFIEVEDYLLCTECGEIRYQDHDDDNWVDIYSHEVV